MNRKLLIGIVAATTTVVIAGCAFFYFREEKEEMKHSAAPKPDPSPHFAYVADMWFKLEDEEKSMTDAVPELHAQMDKFIRGLVNITKEQREELHTYNTFKLGLNSPL